MFLVAGDQLCLCSSKVSCHLCQCSHSVLDSVSVIHETQGVCACVCVVHVCLCVCVCVCLCVHAVRTVLTLGTHASSAK